MLCYTMGMVKLRRVTFHRFPNLQPGCTLEFGPGVNVLFGRNGTGKTTLLRALAWVLGGLDAERLDHEYDVELIVDAELENGSIQFCVKLQAERVQSPPPSEDEVPFELRNLFDRTNLFNRANEHTRFQCKAVLETLFEAKTYRCIVSEDQAELQVDGRSVAAVNAKSQLGPPWGLSSLPLEIAFGLMESQLRESVAARFYQWFISNIPVHFWGELARVFRADEALALFESLRDTLISIRVSDGNPPLLSTPLTSAVATAVESELTNNHYDQNVPESLTLSSEHIGGFLAESVRLFDFERATVTLALQAKSPLGDVQICDYKWSDTHFVRRDGSIVSKDLLSFGQKRMLALLHYLELNPAIAIIDEMVNGLHHEWIEAAMDKLGERQAILTSQNPLLLDYLEFESAEDVRTRFILCTSVPDGDRDIWVWRNPTPEEAEDFFRAYEVGIQHVGELLIFGADCRRRAAGALGSGARAGGGRL